MWHDTKGDTDANYDEFNEVTVPGSQEDCYYHYYGYNNDNDPPAFATNGNQHTDDKFYTQDDPMGAGTLDDVLPLPRLTFECSAATRPGPLRLPGAGENAHYMYRDVAGGGAEPVFLLSLARPWAVIGNPAPWGQIEQIDRSVHLYPPMNQAGVNLNYTWWAPWETQLVHNKTNTEIWYPTSMTKTEHTVDDGSWSPYRYYDQGRAKRMDEIVQGHRDAGVYLALTTWSHQSLQETDHPWPESGWDNKDNDEEKNGFSNLNTDVEDFLNAAADINTAKWLHQKNFYRYVMARYAYSSAIAMWVTLDESEGIGDADDFCEDNEAELNRWHDELTRVVREFDYFNRPITASSTYWNRNLNPMAETEKGTVHGSWHGGAETFDLLSHHSYHSISRDGISTGSWSNSSASWWRGLGDRWGPIFYPLCGRMYRWVENTQAVGVPRWLVTESALTERNWDEPQDPVNKGMIRSYVHFAAWSAFAAGHMGNPLKWCDGKEFGEMFQRDNAEPFDAAHYPQVSDELQALRGLLQIISLDELRTVANCDTDDGTQGGPSPLLAWGIRSANNAVIWVFDNDFNKAPGPTWGQSARSPSDAQDTSKAAHRVVVELPPGTYTVRFFNTWDGGAYYHQTTLTTVLQDGKHLLLIPMARLATTIRTPDEVWDGADCILVIEPQQ